MPKRMLAAHPTVRGYHDHVQRRPLASWRQGQLGASHIRLVAAALVAAATLPSTIPSAQRHKFASTEHIVVDGGSGDEASALLGASLRSQNCRTSGSDTTDAISEAVALSPRSLGPCGRMAAGLIVNQAIPCPL